MEVHLSERVVAALRAGPMRRDFRALARRLQADEGRWRLVMIDQRHTEAARGAPAHIREGLAGVGCRAQVVGMLGLGRDPRPWSGIAVFARVPA